MHHELEVHPTVDAVAAAAAERLAAWIDAAVAERGGAVVALSGGRTPWRMLAELARLDGLPWARVTVHQVDERVAPAGDPDRNLTHITEHLGATAATIVALPVEEADLDAAATRAGTALPERFDVVHLGLGADGHTASLVPGDPVLDVTDRAVAVTAPYQGHRRMTLTYPALTRARQLLWLVTGAEKVPALGQLLAGDQSIPAGRVKAAASLVLADVAATGTSGEEGP